MTSLLSPADIKAVEMIEILRDAACEYLGDDFIVDQILKINPKRGNEPDVDHLEQLADLMEALAYLCGDYHKAAEWLFRSEAFWGDSPYLALQEGNFWSLTTMADWAKILAEHKGNPAKLYDQVFALKC